MADSPVSQKASAWCLDRRHVLAHLSTAIGAGAATMLGTRISFAAWPDHPIRVVVPFAAGGAPDFVARVLVDPLSIALGETIVVDNKSGAGGTVGVINVARSEPDGYTLLMCTSAYIVNKALNDHLGYDPIKDFTPICELVNSPNVFVVNPDLGVYSLKEFVAFARAQPNGVNYSSPGTGTTPQLSSELFRVRANIPMTHIPYNSGPQAAQAVLTNLVQLSCSAVPLVQSYIEAGKLRPLAVTSATRWRGMPDVPTMAEAGFDDFITDTMVMLIGPAGLPPEIVTKLSGVVQVILEQPAVREPLQRGGFDVVAKPGNELATRISKQVAMWHDIVAATGLSQN